MKAGRDVGPILAFLAFAGVYVVFVMRTTFTYDGVIVGTLFDDSLISLRYAHNLFQGYGLVWNPGERPPVEGYSNPLWTLLMSVAFFIASPSAAPLVVSAIGGGVLLASGCYAMRIARSADAGPGLVLLCAVLILSCFPFVFWTLRGMEVGLVGLFVLAATALVLEGGGEQSKDATLTGVALISGLAFLARPDAVLLFVPHLVLLAWRRPLSWRLAAAVSPLAACIAAQFVFRALYYGELLPNTYTLKMTGVPPTVRIPRGWNDLLDAAPVLLVATAVAARLTLTRDLSSVPAKLALLCSGAAALQIVYFLWIGGDAWTFDNSNRFLATITPLLLVGAALCLPQTLSHLGKQRRAHAAFVVVVAGGTVALAATRHFWPASRANLLAIPMILLLCLWPLGGRSAARARSDQPPSLASLIVSVCLFLLCNAPGWYSWLWHNAPNALNDMSYAKTGMFMKAVFPPDTSYAGSWLGAPSYYSGFHSIDMLGKTDKHIARMSPVMAFRPGHNKLDLDYSIGTLKPDLVLLFAGPGLAADAPAAYGYLPWHKHIWLRPSYFEAVKDLPGIRNPRCPGSSTIDLCLQGAF